MYVIQVSGIDILLGALRDLGYICIGPTVRDNAIVYDRIESLQELPAGWTDEQEPASYSLHRRNDDALFGFVVGPHSWKRFLFPPRTQLCSLSKQGKGFRVGTGSNETRPPRYAFVGVRSCELHAIAIQDKVFLEGDFPDPHYAAVRGDVFIVAVNCTQAGGNCFCVSMNTGPKAVSGFDLALTEILMDNEHAFVVEPGSAMGESIVNRIPHRAAETGDIERVEMAMNATSSQVRKRLDTTDLVQLLYNNLENPEWDAVAKRCLACANCTMVCPTCFCSTVEDLTDLSGEHAERWRRWDSCFTTDFAKVAGGNFRPSMKARYRQWLTHKLGSWNDQFGLSGCVGCGRCITWCPVGIDITDEVRVIRENDLAKEPSYADRQSH